MSSLSDNTTRRCLEMAKGVGYASERTSLDGYENHTPPDHRSLLFTLVCGSCGHRPVACDCPASVQRSVPLRPARS